LPGVTLVQCGGHFPGSAVVHWASGAEGRGVLLSGDTIFVTPGEDRVSFVWSAPNRLPLSEQGAPAPEAGGAPSRLGHAAPRPRRPVSRRRQRRPRRRQPPSPSPASPASS